MYVIFFVPVPAAFLNVLLNKKIIVIIPLCPGGRGGCLRLIPNLNQKKLLAISVVIIRNKPETQGQA